jgi:DNA-binding winged helix-turn-helix (wHTH) protein
MAGQLQFPPFTIDVQRRRLMREGEAVDLSPRLVEILAHLAGRPAELVSKDDLLDRFWPDVHVTENTLTRAIADIRKALGDVAGEPRYIQTVARRGYRFIASVDSAAPVAEPRDASGTNPFLDWVKGRVSLEALDASKLPEAIAAFERAVIATPDYAPAHAGLANACFLQFEQTRTSNVPERALLTRAIAHARKATELDAHLGEGWSTLGFLLSAAGEVEEARAVARHAAALEPTSWRHHFRLAIATWGEERLRAVDRTLALYPDFAPAHFLASMVFIARHAMTQAEQTAAKASAAQTATTGVEGVQFPSVGAHWLHGLLLLRRNAIGPAILSFVREIDESRESRVYGREFRLNAQVGAGFAHLAASDAAGAVEAFRAALELVPENGRALIGLHGALSHTVLAAEAAPLLDKAERAVVDLMRGGRPAEAAMIKAALECRRGNLDAAMTVLDALLEKAPPGQTGWNVVVDPALAPLWTHQGFERLMARLAARAS